LGGVSLTEERKEMMLFPDVAMGTDQYYLYKRAEDTSISNLDLSTLSGKKVGGIRDNRLTTFLIQWAQDNSVDLILYITKALRNRKKISKQANLISWLRQSTTLLILAG